MPRKLPGYRVQFRLLTFTPSSPLFYYIIPSGVNPLLPKVTASRAPTNPQPRNNSLGPICGK